MKSAGVAQGSERGGCDGRIATRSKVRVLSSAPFLGVSGGFTDEITGGQHT